ncbi:SPOR domain-containing protein [Qipengyuania sp. DSG2-2]|uniref:SPOR domain-containing protein n=1 Tax=Qipengyuania sp. DGS2-2 TaxID=3349631 RepID=UPI0036D33B7A
MGVTAHIMRSSNHTLLLIGAAMLGGLIAVPGAPASAQGRAVVQPLPPAATNELNRALRRLASNPRDVDALILAGNASLELDDVDAAIGFFGRAEELSPNNPRVKSGTAAAYVRVRRPVEALRLFAEAERAGVRPTAVAGDKGLAHDLVGNNLDAQFAYRQSLAFEDNSEIRRRMALSYAISGDSEGFESTLLPLLEQRDFAAYRTRAFGLAILGKPDEAVAIADAVMPEEMADRLEPYLRYMRRLTPAQQAAAANLGIFPRASAIGRDDPRIAAARSAGSAPTIAGVDAGLTPSGQPLGQAAGSSAGTAGADEAGSSSSGALTAAQRRALLAQRRQRGQLRRGRPEERRVRVAQTQPAEAATQQAAPTPAATSPTPTAADAARTERGELPALARADVPAVVPESTPATELPPASDTAVQVAQAEQAAPPSQTAVAAEPAQELAQQTPEPVTQVAVAPSSVVPEPALPAVADEAVATATTIAGAAPAAANQDEPVTVAALDPTSLPTGSVAAPAPGFDLGDIATSQTSPAITAEASTASAFPATDPVASAGSAPSAALTEATQIASAGTATAPSASTAPETAAPIATEVASAPEAAPTPSVSQAFADLMALPDTSAVTPPSNAVDITAIDIPREEEAAPEEEAPEPAAPANASRIWVQIATGRDRSALRFDWRRFSRQAPDVLDDNGPFVASWGDTNRLLAGPFENRTAANTAVSALAEAGIGAFRFTSADGQEIEELGR